MGMQVLCPCGCGKMIPKALYKVARCALISDLCKELHVCGCFTAMNRRARRGTRSATPRPSCRKRRRLKCSLNRRRSPAPRRRRTNRRHCCGAVIFLIYGPCEHTAHPARGRTAIYPSFLPSDDGASRRSNVPRHRNEIIPLAINAATGSGSIAATRSPSSHC
eukprot:SAG31_NODE_4069_length_3619_cov_17.893466_6_plen_163_part_00